MIELDVQLLTLAAALAVMVTTWAISVPIRDASIADIAWGPASVAIAWTAHAVGDGAGDRSLVIAICATLWGLRLAAHIAARHEGEDRRYRKMRERAGSAFALRSLITVFVLQALLAWVISAPVQVAAADGDPAGLGAVAVIGIAIFTAGFAFEAIADLQLTRFRSDPDNQGQVLDSGLWRYSRHPNYFGEVVLWWGIWVIALESGSAWWTAVGPALLTFMLLRVSGVSLTERTITERRPAYRDYIERTSAFVPWPPERR